MYANVWNRVGLLAAGLAFGWNLVNYWCVADTAKASQLVKVLMGLAGGLLIVFLLAYTSPRAALVGGSTFLFCALVGYAGNAKQVGKAREIPLARVERPSAGDGGLVVVLLGRGEPPSYDGPEPWARRLLALAAKGQPIPHWLARPRTLARIRAAYRAMGAENPANRSVAQLAQRLSQRLGPDRLVSAAFVETPPSLSAELARLAQAGVRRVLILPLSQDPETLSEMHRQVARSRGREVGLSVRFAPPYAAPGWPTEDGDERLRTLCRGEPVAPPALASDAALEPLQAHLENVLAGLDPGSPPAPSEGKVHSPNDV